MISANSMSGISVVTWDSSFRESLHWFDAMQKQSDRIPAEFIWVDFYGLSERIHNIAARDPRTRVHTLAQPASQEWHLGHSVNAGVANSEHEWLLLTDGDIFVGPDFLDQITNLTSHANEVTYFRRYDE